MATDRQCQMLPAIVTPPRAPRRLARATALRPERWLVPAMIVSAWAGVLCARYLSALSELLLAPSLASPRFCAITIVAVAAGLTLVLRAVMQPARSQIAPARVSQLHVQHRWMLFAALTVLLAVCTWAMPQPPRVVTTIVDVTVDEVPPVPSFDKTQGDFCGVGNRAPGQYMYQGGRRN